MKRLPWSSGLEKGREGGSAKRLILLDSDPALSAIVAVHLAEAGFSVSLRSTRPPTRLGLSMYCREDRVSKYSFQSEALEQLIASSRDELILPLGDEHFTKIWRLSPSLTNNVLPVTDGAQRAILGDRRLQYGLAEELGIAVPKMRTVDMPESLKGIVREFGCPLVLRGTDGLARNQVFISGDLSTLSNAYKDLKARSPGIPFAQPFIRGPRCLFGGLFHEGRVLQWFSHSTIEARSLTGRSVRVVSIVDDRLKECGLKIFSALRWSGLACAEFIRTENREFSFMEVNGRPWAAIQASHRCGVPLLRLYANYLSGRACEPPLKFNAGKEVTLFPQFIQSRASSIRPRLLADWRSLAQSIADAPWTRPFLLFHLVKLIFTRSN